MDLTLGHIRRVRLPRSCSISPSGCSTRNGATRAGSRSCTSSASSSASPGSGSIATWSAPAAHTRPNSCTCRSPIWPAKGSRRPSRAAHRRPPGQGFARPVQPHGLDHPREFQHFENRPLADRFAPSCHINWVILDSDWEGEFCRVAEVASAGPGLRQEPQPRPGGSLPLRLENRALHARLHRRGRRRAGEDDPLHLIVEIKGYRGEDAKDKKNTMDAYWVPG